MYTDAYAQLGYLGMGILFVMQTFVLYTVLLAFNAKKKSILYNDCKFILYGRNIKCIC